MYVAQAHAKRDRSTLQGECCFVAPSQDQFLMTQEQGAVATPALLAIFPLRGATATQQWHSYSPAESSDVQERGESKGSQMPGEECTVAPRQNWDALCPRSLSLQGKRFS